MEHVELTWLLDGPVAAQTNEVVVFKQANDNFSADEIGKYFAAVANEANLQGAGWFVFGVHNKTRWVMGTACRSKTPPPENDCERWLRHFPQMTVGREIKRFQRGAHHGT